MGGRGWRGAEGGSTSLHGYCAFNVLQVSCQFGEEKGE